MTKFRRVLLLAVFSGATCLAFESPGFADVMYSVQDLGA